MKAFIWINYYHSILWFVSVACKILTTNEQEKATTTKEFVFLHRFNLLMNMAIFFHLLLMIILNETRGKKMSKQSIKWNAAKNNKMKSLRKFIIWNLFSILSVEEEPCYAVLICCAAAASILSYKLWKPIFKTILKWLKLKLNNPFYLTLLDE